MSKLAVPESAAAPAAGRDPVLIFLSNRLHRKSYD